MVNYKKLGLKIFLTGVGTAVILNISPGHLLKNESRLIEQNRISKKIENDSRLAIILKKEQETKKIYNQVKRDLEKNSLESLALNLENYPLVTFNILKENWKKKIIKNPNLMAGLEKSIERSKNIMPSIKYEFIEKNIPQKYAFLGIIESDWRNVTSGKGAKGVFQQMSSTAKKFGAIINKNYDERLNPLLAARKTADILNYLHSEFGDWDLALAAYNSKKFPWGYLSESKKSGNDISLEGYLGYFGKIIKNNPKNKKLLSFLEQNLGFLKKNNGLYEILENRYPEIFNLEPRKDSRKIYEISDSHFEYKIKSGDSLWKVAEVFTKDRYGVKDNKITNRAFQWIKKNLDFYEILHPGQVVSFQTPNTLREIEYQTGTNLRKENPHVKEYQTQLPNGAKIFLNQH